MKRRIVRSPARLALGLSAGGVLLGAVTACGAPDAASPPGGVGVSRAAVVGGVIDKTTTGVVGLAVDFPGHFFFGHCSGSLIAPNLVLTARHCVSLLSTADDSVVCGSTEFTSTGTGNMFLASPATVRPVRADDPRFYRGADLRVAPGDNDVCGHDIALIILEGEGIPASAAKPLVPRIDRTPDPSETFSADGFGLTSPDSRTTDGTRMRLDGALVDCVGTDCESLGGSVRETEWRTTGIQTCPGDSGGPALDVDGRVIGVVSRGAEGCIDTIYGDVASWREFIIETALHAADLGGYEPPFWTSGSSTPPVGSEPPPVAAPPPNLFGIECTGECGDGFLCFAETGTPPGVCMPECSPGSECPPGYACADSLGACAPEESSVFAADGPGEPASESGCAVSKSRTGGGVAAMPGLLLGALLALRRRRGQR